MSRERDKKLLLLVALVTVMLLGIGWLAQGNIVKKIRLDTREQLAAHLDVQEHNLHVWRESQKDTVRVWASTEEFRQFTQTLLDVNERDPSPRGLVEHPVQQELREWMTPIQAGNKYLGYFVISRAGVNLASSRNINIGTQSLLNKQPGLLAAVWGGKTTISLPQFSDVPLNNLPGEAAMHRVTMFVATPVRESTGEVVAILALRINVDDSFMDIFTYQNTLGSMETHVFQRDGLLLTHSRFEAEMRARGLLAADAYSVLSTNLHYAPQRRITEDAAPTYTLIETYRNIEAGGMHINLDGYRNYRGADVIGAWRWLPDIAMGLAVEVARAEAYRILRITRNTIVAFTIFAVLLLILLAYVFVTSRNKNLEIQQQLAGIINMSEGGIISIDENQRVILFNPAAEDIFGYREDEALGQPVTRLIPEYLRGTHQNHVALISGSYGELPRLSRKKDNKMLTGLRKNGEEFPIEVSISRQVVGNKAIVTAEVYDKSEILQAEANLREEQNRARHYLDTAEAFMVAIDPRGMVTLINRKGCQMLGRKEQEVVGRYWFDLALPEEERAQGWAIFQGILNDNSTQVHVNERPLNSLDGSKYYITWYSSLILDESGATVGVLNCGLDVTAAKKSEAEQTRLRGQLMRAQKAESIGQLTGGIAHDFNNMLASIRGYTELSMTLPESKQNPKLNDYLNQVHKTCLRAADLVKKLLAFSKGTESELKLVSLEDIVKQSFAMLGPVLPSSITINSDIEPGLPKIMADIVELDQVVVNLCINARDAMEGEGAIDVRMRRVVGIRHECVSCHHSITGDYVQLSVKDYGPGIAQDAIEKLFEPFYTTKEVGKGTGLGLAMVHGIVHAHGGHIRVLSDSGAGAEFVLYFPCAKEIETPLLKNPIRNEASGTSSCRDSRHILLVDDQQDVADMMSELLSYLGYQVSVYVDSLEALRRYEQAPDTFDLLLTDQTMPNMTGVELAKAVLAIRPEIPVVLFTGFSTAVNEESALAMGIRAYVEKPVDTGKLIAKLNEILSPAAETLAG